MSRYLRPDRLGFLGKLNSPQDTPGTRGVIGSIRGGVLERQFRRDTGRIYRQGAHKEHCTGVSRGKGITLAYRSLLLWQPERALDTQSESAGEFFITRMIHAAAKIRTLSAGTNAKPITGNPRSSRITDMEGVVGVTLYWVRAAG